MEAAADFYLDDSHDDGHAAGQGSGKTLHLSGPLVITTLGNLDDRLRDIDHDISIINLKNVTAVDTVGAWIVHRLSRDHGAQIIGASQTAQQLIAEIGDADQPGQVRAPELIAPLRILNQVGGAVVEAMQSLLGMMGFVGALLMAILSVMRHPGRFRFKAMIRHFELVGVTALGIVGLMSFLIGIVIAQQGAVQLRQFGAEIFTVNLVGRLTLRELGVLMTAIMVAGRSGSAFAAQIGTMKLTEEVDAMRTIGVSPMEALVLPRVMAAVLMMPLLGFYASMVAMFGGAVLCSIVLDIPIMTFVTTIQQVVPIHDLWVGLIKAPVFGAIVALSGCYQGMLVAGSAENVGLKTTSAVVQAIFMVIVLDAFFAIFFTWIGWG